jgi:hypothetical protein
MILKSLPEIDQCSPMNFKNDVEEKKNCNGGDAIK